MRNCIEGSAEFGRLRASLLRDPGHFYSLGGWLKQAGPPFLPQCLVIASWTLPANLITAVQLSYTVYEECTAGIFTGSCSNWNPIPRNSVTQRAASFSFIPSLSVKWSTCPCQTQLTREQSTRRNSHRSPFRWVGSPHCSPPVAWCEWASSWLNQLSARGPTTVPTPQPLPMVSYSHWVEGHICVSRFIGVIAGFVSAN